MGIYDRDYYRQSAPRGGFGYFSMWSVTTWLIVINVAVFLIDSLLLQQSLSSYGPGVTRLPGYVRVQLGLPAAGPLETWGNFNIEQGVYQLQLWRVITCQFLHANVQHLFGNMLGLFLFGQIVEGYFSRQRYLAFYLLCGCAGVLCYTLMYFTHILDIDPRTPLVGASAGIFGILIAAAVIAPDVEIILFFPPIPVRIKYMAIFMMGVAAYTALTNGRNAGGEAAHLGGGALGYFLIRNPQLLNPFGSRRRMQSPRKRTRFSDWSKDPNR